MLAYWVPEHFGGSGVLAAVAAGLYVSWNGPLLIPAATRLQGIFFWDLIIYLIEGIVFLVTGLQARTLIERIDLSSCASSACHAPHHSGRGRCTFRLVFPATYRAALAEPVALTAGPVAALAVAVRFSRSSACAASSRLLRRSPFRLTTATGAPFPDRDLILFITFGLIIITLVGWGCCCPPCALPRARLTTPRRARARARRPSSRRARSPRVWRRTPATLAARAA